jgi:hypothetical protein
MMTYVFELFCTSLLGISTTLYVLYINKSIDNNLMQSVAATNVYIKLIKDEMRSLLPIALQNVTSTNCTSTDRIITN